MRLQIGEIIAIQNMHITVCVLYVVGLDEKSVCGLQFGNCDWSSIQINSCIPLNYNINQIQVQHVILIVYFNSDVTCTAYSARCTQTSDRQNRSANMYTCIP